MAELTTTKEGISSGTTNGVKSPRSRLYRRILPIHRNNGICCLLLQGKTVHEWKKTCTNSPPTVVLGVDFLRCYIREHDSRLTCPVILRVEPTLISRVPSSSHTPGSTCTFREQAHPNKRETTVTSMIELQKNVQDVEVETLL